MIKTSYIVLATAFACVPLTAMAQVQDYSIKVTSAELDLISEGLQTQPFGKVFPLINKLRDQIIAQQPKPAPVEVPKVEEGK